MRQVTQFSTLFFYFSLHIGCFKLPNKPPDIALLSPTGVSYTFSNDTYIIKVSAQDPDGVERVEFLVDGKIIGTDRTVPYEFDYKNPSVGVHKITARAVDGKGLAAETASANLTVRGGLDVALEQIIQPTTTVTTTQIFPAIVLKNWGKTLVTSATVSYILDNAAPVLVNWQGVLDANGGQTPVYLTPIRNENGYHNLSVKLEKVNGRADDDATNDAKSRTFLSSVVNTPPSVNMVAPAARSEVFQDESFIFEATATDRDGLIKRVDFFTDKVFLGSASTAPYTLTRRDLPIGTYKVTARAYDDRDSATTSSETTLVVKPSYEVGITQIVAPTGILSTVYIAPTILVKNFGNKIITSCSIFYELDSSHIVNRLNWLGNIPISSQLPITLPQLRNENGLHNLRVWLDKPNGQADGNPLNNTSTTHFTSSIINTPPSVKMTAPSVYSEIFQDDTFVVEATATDLDGTVKRVDFFRGTVFLGSDSIAPYTFICRNLPIGTHKMTARAYDDRNLGNTSSETTLVVNPSFDMGIVQITSPSGTISTTNIAPMLLVRNYGNKPITSCDIFYEVDSSHNIYSLNWVGNMLNASQIAITLPPIRNENGLHSLRVWLNKVNGQTDDNPLNNSSSTNFKSNIINTPPSVNLTAPIGNVTIRTNQTYTIKASATDLDGMVKKVEFFKGAVYLGIDSLAPYEFTVNNLPIGTYSITAVATDDRAATTFSTAATLTVIASATLSDGGDSSEIVAFSRKNTIFIASSTPSVFSIKKEENSVFDLNESLVLSPNPAKAFVNLSVKDLPVGIYTVSLNQLGGYRQQQKSWVITERQEQLQLPLSAALPAGWYIVTVSNRQVCWSKKLYISR